MTLRRRIVDYSVAGLLLLVTAAVLTSNLKDRDSLNPFDKAVLRITSPLQSVVSWTVEGVGGVWNDYVWLVDVKDENEELRRDNDRLRLELAAAKRSSSHVAALEQLMALKREIPADVVAARVISASTNASFRVVRVRLDRGSDSGLREGLPVVNADGLVGRIHRVYGSYCDVLLVADPRSSIDVVVPTSGSRGVLTGLGTEDSYRAEIEYVERGQEIAAGDLVVTSGLGAALPAGLEVGRVVSVDSSEAGLYQNVEVEPVVDYAELDSVLVLVAPPPPPDPNADREQDSPVAHRLRPL